jgi:hypothetical protein
MKKLLYLLAICVLSHLNILAMDQLPKETLLLTQNPPSNLQDRILKFVGKKMGDASTLYSLPKNPELLFLLRIGMRLNDKKTRMLRSTIKAPYRKNLQELLGYLVGYRSESHLKKRWKLRLDDARMALVDFQRVTADLGNYNLIKIIFEDDSLDKTKALDAYYELIKRILDKNKF